MSALNYNVKKELFNALDDKDEAMFTVDGKLVSLEVHDTTITNNRFDNLAEEIEAYPELKRSLQRFLDNPQMKRYSAKVLKELRHEQRK